MKAKAEADELSSRVVDGYRTALKHAKEATSSMKKSSWQEAKDHAAQTFSDAFHIGHGHSRTLFGRLRDTIGRGAWFATKTAFSWTWSLFTNALIGVFWLSLGGMAALWGVGQVKKRRFHKQISSHATGSIIALGEYMVVGDEATQRKFADYWSGPAANYWARQPGFVRQWMQRGVDTGSNGVNAGNAQWLSYSEWATIEDLRRAVHSKDFEQIKKKAPNASVTHHMTLYQNGNGARYEGETEKETSSSSGSNKGSKGTRQRGTATAAH